MEPADVLNELEVALKSVKGKGQEIVTIAALEQVIGELRDNAGSSLELRKLEHQRTLAHYDAQTKHSIEMFKSVLDAGKEALNSLVLVNGGAVVALLGFMGATVAKGLPPSLGLLLARPMLYFGAGVLLGALGFGARYLSQACYSGLYKKTGDVFRTLAIVFSLAGYLSFGCGMYGAYSAFSGYFRT